MSLVDIGRLVFQYSPRNFPPIRPLVIDLWKISEDVTKSYVGGITCDALCKKLVSERNYKTLRGPNMNDIIYVRTPYESLDANLRNPSVKEWIDIGILPQ